MNFEVYADSGGKSRWRLTSSKGQNIASSGAPFASQSNARRAANNLRDKAGVAAGPSLTPGRAGLLRA